MQFDGLEPGLSAEINVEVDDSLVVKHTGGDGVFSTPSMIALMERAGIQAVQEVLGDSHTTVGFEDPGQPTAGQVFFYLHRGYLSSLPAPESWGFGSGNAERVTFACGS